MILNTVRWSDQTLIDTKQKQSDATAVLLMVRNPAGFEEVKY